MNLAHAEAVKSSNSAMEERNGETNSSPDFYLENGFCVFTEQFLIRKEACCGSGCRHCPYEPKHEKGSVKIRQEVLQNL